MATVAQMIEWMKTLPQDAEVECGVEVNKGYETYMSMDVVENLEAAIAAVEEARSVPLSASCVINRSELLQLLDKIKVSFPNDLAKAISIQREKVEILEDAHEQADAIIEQAREEVARLVEQTTIVSSARKEANRILAEANSDGEKSREEIDA